MIGGGEQQRAGSAALRCSRTEAGPLADTRACPNNEGHTGCQRWSRTLEGLVGGGKHSRLQGTVAQSGGQAGSLPVGKPDGCGTGTSGVV